MFSRVPNVDLPAPVETVDPVVDLIPLAELAAEGFGYGSPYIVTPQDAVDVLARQLADQVIVDDVGRRCVTREVARGMFTERAGGERRRREADARNAAQAASFAAQVPAGIPVDQIPAGLDPATAMLAAAADAERPQRESVLQAALSNRGEIVIHPIREQNGEEE
jgi:hypothetical protein